MNWFEGGRRITRLFQMLLCLGCAIAVFLFPPDVSLTFETIGPDQPWVLTTKNCYGGSDAMEDPQNDAGLGESSTDLCFRAAEFEGGKMLIPYALADKNNWYGAETYSDLAQNYIKKRKAEFRVPEQLKPGIRNQVSREWWKKWRENLKGFIVFAVVGVVILQALAWVMGWIVRGFAGIPAGQDRRTPNRT